MKKFFTLVAAAFTAMAMNAELITFPYGSTLGDNATFTSSNLTVTLTDTDGKFAIDSNSCYFNTAAPVKIATRLKSGGKSTSKLSIKLTATEAGTLKVYARTGSNSATDRNVVLTQGTTELLNHVLLESEATSMPVEGETDAKNVYPVLEAAVAAGDIMVTFPVGSINFYGFELVAGEGPTSGPTDGPVDLQFAALTADDFTNLVNGETTTYTMDGVEAPSINYTGTESAEMTFDCRGVTFSYKNSDIKNNAVKCGGDFIQLDSKNFFVTVKDVKAGQTVNLYVSAKGSTAATFTVGESTLGTATKADNLAAYSVISYTATADGDVKIKETTGGYRLSKIELTEAQIEKTKFQVEVPATTWQCFIAGNFNGWSFTKMTKVDATHYEVELANVKSDTVAYKYCAGDDWAYVEKTAAGADVDNRAWAENDVVAAWAAVPAKTYKYKTIAELCNYIDFHTVENNAKVPTSENKGTTEEPNWEEKDVYTFANGTQVLGSHISTSASSWNLKEDYNSKLQSYTNATDTILFGSQFRGVSGARIVLGEFEVSADGEIQVYWQPNGTSERGVRFTNLYDEENVKSDSITFEDKNVFVVSTFPVKKGYYDGEIEIMVIKNTINIAGINITNLVVDEPVEAIRNNATAIKATKMMVNGQIVIRKNGQNYNLVGARL